MAYGGAAATLRPASFTNLFACAAIQHNPRTPISPAGRLPIYLPGDPSNVDRLDAVSPVLPSRRPISPRINGAHILDNVAADARLIPACEATQSKAALTRLPSPR